MSIAENIKKRRTELNLSQQDLAKAIGYKSRSTIAKIEAGENTIPKKKMPRFARALDTTVDFLETGFVKEQYHIFANKTDKDSSHKNIVIILAGGKSTRNLQNIPNQFVNVLGKPVIMYCLEAYQKHPAIDDIYIVCLEDWGGIVEAYCKQYDITKLKGIIKAGKTGILSVKNGVEMIKSHYADQDVFIFQESTRPLITEEIISKLLNACQQNGSAVTCKSMAEYLQFELNNKDIEASNHCEYLNRQRVVTVESPEAYRLETIIEAFKKAKDQKHTYDETCFAMMLYNLGYELQFYEGNYNNIKVVRQEDIAILSALLKSGF